MPADPSANRRLRTLARALVEVAFIVFLFYANLLMGEFTASAGHSKTLLAALRDVITTTNLAIALLSAIAGYFVFEFLRKKL